MQKITACILCTLLLCPGCIFQSADALRAKVGVIAKESL